MECFSVGDWQLTPEGAIVHSIERIAIIADVHLGYEWARGQAGDSVPAHSLDETIARLDRLFNRQASSILELVVAGDLVESRRPCRRTAADVRQLRLWLDRQGVKFTLVAGNHDPRHLVIDNDRPDSAEILQVAGWSVGHGHVPVRGDRTISGHLHPVFRFEGITAPCFLVGDNRIVLPAFSTNAAGLDVLTRPTAFDSSPSRLRCCVVTGTEVLDFGTLNDLLSRTRGPSSFVRGERGR